MKPSMPSGAALDSCSATVPPRTTAASSPRPAVIRPAFHAEPVLPITRPRPAAGRSGRPWSPPTPRLQRQHRVSGPDPRGPGERAVGGHALREAGRRVRQRPVHRKALGHGDYRILAPSEHVLYAVAGVRPAALGAVMTSPTAGPNRVSPWRRPGTGAPGTPPPSSVRSAANTRKKRFRTSAVAPAGNWCRRLRDGQVSGLGWAIRDGGDSDLREVRITSGIRLPEWDDENQGASTVNPDPRVNGKA